MNALINRLKERSQQYDSFHEWTVCRKALNKGNKDWVSPRLKPIVRKPHPRPLRPSPAMVRRAKGFVEQLDCEHVPPSSGLGTEFDLLADLWERETRNISSPIAIVQHPALQKIIGMGDGVLPLILRRMAHHPWFWFSALMQITGETNNPVTPAIRGDMEKMTDAWLRWGVERGII
jgi:hypothetical protein